MYLCEISCKTTQLLRKRIDCFVETLHTLWSVRYGKLLKFCSCCKISGGGDLYGHNMKLPVRKAMSTASSLLYLKVDNLVISHSILIKLCFKWYRFQSYMLLMESNLKSRVWIVYLVIRLLRWISRQICNFFINLNKK